MEWWSNGVVGSGYGVRSQDSVTPLLHYSTTPLLLHLAAEGPGMTQKIPSILLVLLTLLAACGSSPGQPPPAGAPKGELVSFPSGDLTLHGFLYRPGPASRAPRAGPFPAMLWNHGSGKTPGEKPDLT